MSRTRFAALLLSASLALVALPGLVHAHALLPAALTLRELGGARYAVAFRRPPQLAPRLELVLPPDCARAGRTSVLERDQLVDRFELTCARSLAGRTLHVAGLVAVELSAIIYVARQDGESVRVLLSPARSSFVVPRRSSAAEVLRDYTLLGAEHLATGLDHVLFIGGLMLLVAGVRRQVLTLSAFTLGHSLTLCLSALDVVRLPQRPIEVGIAASLLLLAVEVLRARAAPRPWWMAGVFGLLHGLGFASALAETGLPPHAVALSLLGFNLGVELGQLAVVLALAPCLYAARRWGDALRGPARTTAAYTLGSLAAMWCIERALALGP